MRRIAAVLFLSALICSLLLGQRSQKALALTHVTVIDMTGGPALGDRTVMVTANRITAIGASSKVNVPKGAKVIDAAGKFLIPGLWDMHVHWYERDY